MVLIRLTIGLILGGATVAAFANGSQTYFTADEREAVMRYWAKPGRYTECIPERADSWQVRLTAEGSRWLWNYNKARGIGKGPPGRVPPPQNAEQAVWEAWIDRKVGYDRGTAQVEANRRNGSAENLKSPADPGKPPAALVKLAGEPPLFASAFRPVQHNVTFSEGEVFSYMDHVAMRPRYAYYRFPQGVMSGGTSVGKLPESYVARLFALAGFNETEERVMKAVSLIEGGFDSVNTYDTGFVSVGFIQFAALKDGAGSLGELLLLFKTEHPQAFNVDFRRFGIDVAETRHLVVLDPNTGHEHVGAVAAQKIIDDKRLIAVFQRAGTSGEAYQVCQLKVAKRRYYPAGDALTITLNGQPTKVKVGDVVRSEAGLATLFDRKVNTGNIQPLEAVCERLCSQLGIETVEDLAACEYEIVRSMKYRVDYLVASDLARPRNIGSNASRSGKKRTAKPPPKKS